MNQLVTYFGSDHPVLKIVVGNNPQFVFFKTIQQNPGFGLNRVIENNQRNINSSW
ncbi:hypothetical protein [Larkinella terrae]|uniref:Uncharacterized protein n=1 Tax=Larkinella terrae TaxID=2025311 RepID=A0A7K0ET89_9BACT|nr:hypothetical protein [Larkinella terrae]MRS65027.1 hypothetical protein [Larkinella terrae]